MTTTMTKDHFIAIHVDDLHGEAHETLRRDVTALIVEERKQAAQEMIKWSMGKLEEMAAAHHENAASAVSAPRADLAWFAVAASMAGQAIGLRQGVEALKKLLLP